MLPPWNIIHRKRASANTAPGYASGWTVLFHTCGRIRPLFEDLAEPGVDAIGPQLNLYDLDELAAFSRAHRIALAPHPDRGGSWFYVEIDAGFPFENVEALSTSIAQVRTTG